MKKLALVAVTALLALGLTAAPAHARWDSGWGCGGACRAQHH